MLCTFQDISLRPSSGLEQWTECPVMAGTHLPIQLRLKLIQLQTAPWIEPARMKLSRQISSKHALLIQTEMVVPGQSVHIFYHPVLQCLPAFSTVDLIHLFHEV